MTPLALEAAMPRIGRRQLVLLLIGCDTSGQPNDSLGGITRLQKLLFLLEKEAGITPTVDGFQFTAYKAGPYSSKLYDDLELLENLGLLESTVTAEATDPEKAEIDRLSFDDLMGDGAATPNGDGYRTPDSFEERQFRLTPKGVLKVKEIIDSGEYSPVVTEIRKIKSTYAQYSLIDLLRHVYSKYPEMTEASEILDKVLGTRGRR